jgi:hypothetical protein
VLRGVTSLKFHFMHTKLGSFPDNMVALCDNHDKTYNHHISEIEKSYTGQWSLNLLANYRCNIIWETKTGKNKRQKKKKKWEINIYLSN